jgi:hypothetical protein
MDSEVIQLGQIPKSLIDNAMLGLRQYTVGLCRIERGEKEDLPVLLGSVAATMKESHANAQDFASREVR